MYIYTYAQASELPDIAASCLRAVEAGAGVHGKGAGGDGGEGGWLQKRQGVCNVNAEAMVSVLVEAMHVLAASATSLAATREEGHGRGSAGAVAGVGGGGGRTGGRIRGNERDAGAKSLRCGMVVRVVSDVARHHRLWVCKIGGGEEVSGQHWLCAGMLPGDMGGNMSCVIV